MLWRSRATRPRPSASSYRFKPKPHAEPPHLSALANLTCSLASVWPCVQTCVSNFRLPVLASFPFFPDLLRQLGSVATQLLEATVALATGFDGEAEDFDMVRTPACRETRGLDPSSCVLLH